MLLPTTLIFNPCLADLLFALKESNTAGKVIVLVLFIGSVFVWSVMISKWRELALATKVSDRFMAAYRKEVHPVALFLKRSKYDASPLYVVYEKTCLALGSALESRGANPDDLFMGAVGGIEGRSLDELHVGAIRSVAERNVSDQVLLMETSMGLLATATTTAPFLGLLGTVWGVMEAFAGMGRTGGAMLSAVAPGISGALLTTVIGLLVALPSSIGFNMLSDRIRRMTVLMDNFSQELVSDMERHYRR